MAGIVEKGNKGLFENEIEFNGKYATMLRYLKEEAGIFTYNREGYVISSIVGFINRCKETEDNTDSVKPTSIFASDILKRKSDLKFLYRVIMLLDDEQDYTMEEYRDRAFKTNPDEHMEIMKNNMKLFNSYACGGLEYIYNIFADCDTTEKKVDKLYEFIHNMAIDDGIIEDDKELPAFTPDFD